MADIVKIMKKEMKKKAFVIDLDTIHLITE